MARCKVCLRHLNIQGLSNDETCVCLECRIKTFNHYENDEIDKEYDCVWIKKVDDKDL